MATMAPRSAGCDPGPGSQLWSCLSQSGWAGPWENEPPCKVLGQRLALKNTDLGWGQEACWMTSGLLGAPT